MAAALLQVQELCDHIADFLQHSPEDLKAYALASRHLTASAQRHLFRSVSLMGRRSCDTFCDRMASAPHLLPFVHRLRTAFADGLHERLNTLAFPNHQQLYIEREAPTTPPRVLAAAAQLIGLPSMRRVELWSIRFHSLAQFGLLFAHCTKRLDLLFLGEIHISPSSPGAAAAPPASRAVIKHLELSMFFKEVPWLLDAACPLDVSALTELDYSVFPQEETTAALLAHTRATLTHLKIDPDQAPSTRSTLPALTHLTLVTTHWNALAALRDFITAGLPPLRVLTLEMGVSLPHAAGLSGIVRAVTTAKSFQQLEIVVRVEPYTDEDEAVAATLRSAFAEVGHPVEVWFKKEVAQF
ncbi:hypothetical protein C8R43DRAFT_1240994 [Mycena crocata]|nr:hypothetical protein C8R43DRAFT_1240994 [Mycena crocata]